MCKKALWNKTPSAAAGNPSKEQMLAPLRLIVVNTPKLPVKLLYVFEFNFMLITAKICSEIGWLCE